MTKDDDLKVAGEPRLITESVYQSYWNYGNIWVCFKSSIVYLLIKAKEWIGGPYIEYFKEKSRNKND
ncbi:MAG: hypothetical protein K9I71_10205 [Ignavibacteriales bacterium]|nr:hypothetical protein [Ignavibacteriales bacterium]MCF8316489.1 hypothetical protein [Ignavibacteriales bacterium]MCF8437969.1 hypothetical protein [Ignavibacteriales bacterium]